MMNPSSGKYRERNCFGILQVSAIWQIFVIGCFLGGSLVNTFLAPFDASPSNEASSTNSVKLRSDNASITTAHPLSSSVGTSSDNTNSRDYGNGWHSIEVFYGSSDHMERKLDKDRLWYSQVKQDETVTTLFREKKNGFFVDLAANHATDLSNSYSLETRFGWTGLCIEPNPVYWSVLSYRRCQVVAAVVGKERMEEVLFRFKGNEYGGIAAGGFDNGEGAQKDAEPKYTVTLQEIFERFNVPKVIDYLSLDVEGAEGLVMENFPFDDYKVSVMMVERPKEPLRALFVQKGYKYIKDMCDFGETLWVHESMLDSLDLISLDALDTSQFWTNTTAYEESKKWT